jgi:hypothetical protein
VKEEVGALRAEPEEVAVGDEDIFRPLPEGAAKRLLGEQEVGEMRRHALTVAWIAATFMRESAGFQRICVPATAQAGAFPSRCT